MRDNIKLISEFASCLEQLRLDSHALFLDVKSYIHDEKFTTNASDVMTTCAATLHPAITGAHQVIKALQAIIPS